MRRFWLEESSQREAGFEIEGEKFKHICQVCRMDVGAKFEILLGDGFAYFVELTTREKKTAFAKIINKRELQSIPKPYIHLYLSLPKISRFEWILEKSVELGVKSVVPLFSDYSFLKKQDLLNHKAQRWEKIVESACQQSGRSERMLVENPISLDAALNRINQKPGFVGLFAYEGDSKLSLKEALKSSNLQQAEEIALFVGSEGGFSAQEVEKFKNVSLDPVSLGEQILRVETACVTLISVLKYELDLFDWA